MAFNRASIGFLLLHLVKLAIVPIGAAAFHIPSNSIPQPRTMDTERPPRHILCPSVTGHRLA